MLENQASGILAGHPQAMEGSGGFVFPSFGLRESLFPLCPHMGLGDGKVEGPSSTHHVLHGQQMCVIGGGGRW